MLCDFSLEEGEPGWLSQWRNDEDQKQHYGKQQNILVKTMDLGPRWGFNSQLLPYHTVGPWAFPSLRCSFPICKMRAKILQTNSTDNHFKYRISKSLSTLNSLTKNKEKDVAQWPQLSYPQSPH